MRFSDILPPRSWRRRFAITIVAVFFIYTVVGFFLVPTIARPRLEAALADLVGRPAKVGGLSFNPFALSVSVRDFELDDGNGEPLISFAELYGDVSALALLGLNVKLDSVHLEEPRVRLVLDKNGNLNVVELFATEEATEPPPAESESDALFPVDVGSITISGGHLLFRDEGPKQPYEVELQPLDLELLDFSTRRDHTGKHVISAATGKNGSLQWTGSLGIDPLRAEGEIALDKIALKSFASYGADTPLAAVRKGLVSLKAKYVYEGSTGSFALGPADLGVDSLEMRESEDAPPFLTLPQLRVTGVGVDLDKQRVSIAGVSSKGARLNVWLKADGGMGPPALFGSDAAEQNEPSAPPEDGESPAWSVAITEIGIADYGVAFEDRSFEKPFAFAVEPIELKAKDFSLDTDKKATVDVTLGLPGEGSIKAAGSVGVTPLAVDLKVAIDDVGLGQFQPYVTRVAHVDIESGAAGIDGDLKVHAGDDGEPVIEYSGSASVRDLTTSDTIRDEELIKWTSLQLNELAYVSAPASLRINEVVVDEPYARILIGKEGNLNLAELGAAPAAEAEPSAPANGSTEETAEAEPFAVDIDVLRMKNGQTDFADFSIEPNVSTGIYALNGEVQQLSSDSKAKAKIDLEGKVDKRSPVKISGVINPFNPVTQTNIGVTFSNVSLTIFTPYSARFAGYKIKKGKASLDLNYHVEDRRLVAENEVVLDQLTLGEKVKSPDATGLPVSMAVALLKDRHGRITLNLPVRGNLDDPKFSFSTILVNALIDLIKKTVASPFSILGTLTDFDSDELKYVEFEPGNATLSVEETKKLDAISEALKQRPALRLEVSGGVDRLADAAALGEVELTKALKRAKKAKLKAEGLPAPKKLSAVELSDEEYDQLFVEAYTQKFGTNPPRDDKGDVTPAAQQALAGSFEIDDNDLRDLAKKRAAAIHDRIIENGVEEDRVYLVESDLLRTKEEGEVRSELSLTS